MMRYTVLSVMILALVTIQVGVNGQDSKPKTPPKVVAPPPLAGGSVVKKAEPVPAVAAAKRSPDELAILQTGTTYVTAFNEANAKIVADHYTTDAEYIDENGRLFQGRAAIEESLKTLFAEHSDCKIELNIGSIRMIGAGAAIEDGTTTVVLSKNAEPVTNRYTAVHLKNAGKWQIASVRETTIKPVRQHRAHLKQLDWMLGEWVHEGGDAVVFFSCELAEKGNFLLRNFTIQIAGQEALSGTQRIGWDAQNGKLKSWIFDSDGGHSEGYWHRDGDSWVLKTTGVTADGMTASSTSIYTFVNEHTMTFQSVDHEVSGVELPDGDKVKIVRHAPQPQ